MIFTQLFEDDFNDKKKLGEAYDPAQASKYIAAATKAAKVIFNFVRSYNRQFRSELANQYGFDPNTPGTEISDHNARELVKWLNSKGCELSYDRNEPIEFSLTMPDQAQPYTFNILDMIQGGEVEESLNEFQAPAVDSWLNVGQQQAADDEGPGNYSVIIIQGENTHPGTIRTQYAYRVKEAVESILPQDFPKTAWPEVMNSENTPTHRVIQQLMSKGRALVKSGISREVAQALGTKFKKIGVNATIEGGMNEELNEFQLPGVGSWLNVGQQQQATDDTPGNFSIVVSGTMPRDFKAEVFAKALESILPKDYPRSGWPYSPGYENTPTHHVIQQVVNNSQAVVKDGIGSKDVADSIAVKFKKYGIPAYVEGGMNESMEPMPEFYAGQEITWRPKFAKMIMVPATVVAAAPGKLKIKLQSPRLIQTYGKDTIVVNIADSDIMPKQGVAEARAATARFRTGNKKRAELNAMSDEERRAYDKEQQEKQRKRDDARLEREREKLAAKKKVAEGQDVDVSVVVGKLYDIIDQQEDAIKNADYDRQVKYATIVRNRAIEALNMIKLNPRAANSAWKYFQTGQQGVAENSMADFFAKAAQEKFPTATIRKNGQTIQEPPKRDVPKQKVDVAKLKQQYAELKKKYDQLGGDSWQYADRMMGRDIEAQKVHQQLNNLARWISNATKDNVKEQGRDTDQEYIRRISIDEGRMNEIYAEYQDYKKLSPREFYNMYRITKQQWLEKHKGLLQTVSEANKKKDELDTEVRDVALQRAISKAKADFPTAGSGLEALAKDFMRSQDQDQKSFDQIRQAERQQDRMLAQIDQIDQEQNREISGLEKQNSSLTQRLQQLQSVNSQLEKKLSSMSGRKEKSDATSTAPGAEKPAAKSNFTAVEPAAKSNFTAVEPAAKAKKPKKKTPSPMASTAKQLSKGPDADPIAAMTQRITRGDSSVTDKITGQGALPFEPTGNVLEPVIPQRQQDPRFAAARANASDVDPRYYADLTSKIAKKAIADPNAAQQAYTVHENDKDDEADYGDKYQDMVARVGQKAREQEKNKPVDIADLARRLAAIEASRKDK